MNRLTRIVVATVIGFGLSRVMPPEPPPASADAEAPELHPIIVGLHGAPAFKWSKPTTPYLDSMRTRFELDAVTATARTDFDRVRILSHWVHSQTADDTQTAGLDPISILDAATAERPADAEEYAAALTGALNSLGLPARVLNLKRADSETRLNDAEHVVTEAYLRDARRWMMVDGQYDVTATLDGKPASALDIRNALKEGAADLVFRSRSGTHPSEYARWIKPYLHFMDSRVDQRMGVATSSRVLMLIPEGTRPPREFRREPLRNTIYTMTPAAFYPRPLVEPPSKPGEG